MQPAASQPVTVTVRACDRAGRPLAGCDVNEWAVLVTAHNVPAKTIADLDPCLFAVRSGQQKRHVGAIDFYRANGRLFMMEPLADGDSSIIHVWQVR